MNNVCLRMTLKLSIFLFLLRYDFIYFFLLNVLEHRSIVLRIRSDKKMKEIYKENRNTVEREHKKS